MGVAFESRGVSQQNGNSLANDYPLWVEDHSQIDEESVHAYRLAIDG